ncbi:DUF131 domain-containing protein [Methanolobus sp. ZRKC2]|uniref:TIGR00304 family membrane protein n=1 Tax=Methanolobus sp. ZRKC2 TaxID=3125783 RepID=UPI00325298D2
MSALLISVGMLLIMLGFLFIILGSMGSMLGNRENDESSGAEVKGSGLIMIGPIPIIFGSDNKSAQTLIILAIALMVIYFIVFR